MWINMKFAWITITGVLLISLVSNATSKSPAIKEREDSIEEIPDQLAPSDVKEDAEQSPLPILPPLILLDFTDDSNSSSIDEKTKRTVNDHFGFGYQSNNLFAGRKYNYYFPTGKSGTTTVSIEESISPFVPRTIIERTKPVIEKPESNGISNAQASNAKSFGFRSQQFASFQQPEFGEKTKFHSNKGGTFDSYQRITSTTKEPVTTTTQRSVFSTTSAPTYSGFLTQKPLFRPNPSAFGSYTTQKPFYARYTTPAPPGQIKTTFTPPLENTFNKFAPLKTTTTTPNPVYSSEQYYTPIKTAPSAHGSLNSNSKHLQSTSPLSDYPKYTFENGIKYEHKIVWKYPDGRISNEPPSSYINSYSEYDSVPINPSNPETPEIFLRNKDLHNYNLKPVSNVRYQGPVQFPKDSEVNFSKQLSPFVKPSGLGQQANTNEVPRNYQYYYNSDPRYSVPKLPVATSDAEYLPPPENNPSKNRSPVSSSYFTSEEQLPSASLSKYSTESQKVFNKVLSPPKESYDSDDSDMYTSSNYANLLNYNPSISQYIKNPASILNAQPTFIQAGGSLIPVIILRVDGAPPVQQKPTPNINLKALLQQYLSQYASNVNDFSRGTNYDFEEDDLNSENSNRKFQDPHYYLKQLTDTLKQYSQQSSQKQIVADNVTDSYGKTLNSDEYKPLVQSRSNPSQHSSYRKIQKVKNVQIVEDPRFPDLKPSN